MGLDLTGGDGSAKKKRKEKKRKEKKRKATGRRCVTDRSKLTETRYFFSGSASEPGGNGLPGFGVVTMPLKWKPGSE